MFWLFGLMTLVIFWIPKVGNAEGIQIPSKWDEGLLNTEFHNVSIKAGDMESAWREIGSKYLLRANLYMDVRSDSDSESFSFNKETTTGKELIEAFIATYPAYTYTQDYETGVIWIHRKQVNYEDILTQKIKINHSAYQAPAFNVVIWPLCRLLSIQLGTLNRGPSFNYGVDLPTGIYTAKKIVNLCCIANPNKAFDFVPSFLGGGIMIELDDLYYSNPLAPPRAGAVRFWEIEIGKSTNGIPSAVEAGAIMADADPIKRWAARCYFEAATINYRWSDIFEKSGSPENEVWAALGVEAAIYRGINDPQFLVANAAPGFTTNLTQINDPGLALVTSLELAREKQGTNYLYLDTIVSQHKFTEAEIGSIKSDVYRLVHESPLALDKLKSLKLDVPEFSPKALDELADTNIFTLVPAEKQ